MARDPAPAPFTRDRRDGTRSGTGSFRTRPTLGHAIRHRLLSHATDFTARDPATDDTAHDDPLVSDDARKCPVMPGYARLCPDDGRLFPVMSRCRVCPATALRDASGPTIRVRCAAGGHGERYG